jgi:hypothetical protein
MRPVITAQTKFKFGDIVIVNYGFHRGMSGKVWDFLPNIKNGLFGVKVTGFEYHVRTDIGNLDILVEEEQIELAGKK